MEILIKKLNDQATLPAYDREAGPGIDVNSLVEVTIMPGTSAVVSTGIAMAMPVGYVGLIWNQKGTVIGEDIKATAGMVDSGYREEILVELTNTGAEEKKIAPGERVAQILVQKIEHANLIEAEDLSSFDPETE